MLGRGSHDEGGQPKRRDCSCRGESAGFAHLRCIVEYAKQKTEQSNGEDMRKFAEPWRDCPNCRQPYRSELAVDVANEFVNFVHKKYANSNEERKCLGALEVKLLALLRIAPADCLHAHQKEDAISSANKILSLIGNMKTKDATPPKWLAGSEAMAYHGLGLIALNDYTKESAKRAVGYFEKCVDICNEVGWTDNEIFLVAESNISAAKSIQEAGSYGEVCNEEKLETFRSLYDHSVKKWGEQSFTAMESGMNLAMALEKAHRWIEAERLFTKLAAMSKRVHGPDHDFTKLAEEIFQNFKEKKHSAYVELTLLLVAQF